MKEGRILEENTRMVRNANIDIQFDIHVCAKNVDQIREKKRSYLVKSI